MSLIDDIANIILGSTRIFESIENLITDAASLVENVRSEVHHIENFKFDPKWKNRVINVPDAVEKTRDLITDIVGEVRDAFVSLVSNLRAIRHQFQSGIPGERGGGVTHVLDILNHIREAITEIDQTFRALGSFVDALRRAREEFEGLDSLFLQQGNTRVRLKLEDGGVLKVRDGALEAQRG